MLLTASVVPTLKFPVHKFLLFESKLKLNLETNLTVGPRLEGRGLNSVCGGMKRGSWSPNEDTVYPARK